MIGSDDYSFHSNTQSSFVHSICHLQYTANRHICSIKGNRIFCGETDLGFTVRSPSSMRFSSRFDFLLRLRSSSFDLDLLSSRLLRSGESSLDRFLSPFSSSLSVVRKFRYFKKCQYSKNLLKTSILKTY